MLEAERGFRRIAGYRGLPKGSPRYALTTSGSIADLLMEKEPPK
jgi:hypothetical protein